MPIPFEFDFKNPDYKAVFERRIDKLQKIRANPDVLPELKTYYKNNIAQFIIDWGVTLDPRNSARGLPATIPFLLFPKQEEWVDWFIECWKKGVPGLTEKSRDMGVSWLATSVSAAICLLHDETNIGFGSRKERYVDDLGNPNSLLGKVRIFIKNLPTEFRFGWIEKKHSSYMEVRFPETDSIIFGEAGDNMGRGARASIYVKDESAWMMHQELIAAALSETTPCCHDISTPRGMNNWFAQKRFSGTISVQTLHWRDHPAKDEAWYEKKCDEIGDPIIRAQELDLDYLGSVENTLILSLWIQSAIDAHIKLGIQPTGIRTSAIDIADQGKDKNALCGRYGILVENLDEWSGEHSDIFKTIQHAFRLCDEWNHETLIYDADGLGASARGDSRVINEARGRNKIELIPFRGSGGVVNPEKDAFYMGSGERDKMGRKNEDFFKNRKAQAWWALRRRFQLTHKAVTERIEYSKDDIISIPSGLMDGKGKNLIQKLCMELAQPLFVYDNSGKILIDKAPEGAKSPNLSDAIMMAFAPITRRGYLEL